jgi:hypothetical protein
MKNNARSSLIEAVKSLLAFASCVIIFNSCNLESKPPNGEKADDTQLQKFFQNAIQAASHYGEPAKHGANTLYIPSSSTARSLTVDKWTGITYLVIYEIDLAASSPGCSFKTKIDAPKKGFTLEANKTYVVIPSEPLYWTFYFNPVPSGGKISSTWTCVDNPADPNKSITVVISD